MQGNSCSPAPHRADPNPAEHQLEGPAPSSGLAAAISGFFFSPVLNISAINTWPLDVFLTLLIIQVNHQDDYFII